MSTSEPLHTPRLMLLPKTLDDVRAMLAAMTDAQRAEVSPVWLALVEAAVPGDPWVFGFSAVSRHDRSPIGQCGFKAPPAEGVVELAYGVDPAHEGQGFATEMARALYRYAVGHPTVRLVIAHTMDETGASARVLAKSGFRLVGPVIDPEDGRVWRWERSTAMTSLVESIRGEYARYKALAEAAMGQLAEAELSTPAPGGGNSIAAICWHISGNLESRFTDFLASDGEKPWRNREEEFDARIVSRPALITKWERGWAVLMDTLARLHDDQLQQSVTIRGQGLLVHEALHRSLAHTSYHVGQIVYAAKATRGAQWTYLSIPPGKSGEYNQAPALDRPREHEARLSAHVPSDEVQKW